MYKFSLNYFQPRGFIECDGSIFVDSDENFLYLHRIEVISYTEGSFSRQFFFQFLITII